MGVTWAFHRRNIGDSWAVTFITVPVSYIKLLLGAVHIILPTGSGFFWKAPPLPIVIIVIFF